MAYIVLPFLQSLLLTGCCMGPHRDTHGVYRSWYSPQFLPIEGAFGIEDSFYSFRAILSWGITFSKMAPLVLPQLTIMIAFYDLRRCSGSILSSPIPQDDYLDYIYLIIN